MSITDNLIIPLIAYTPGIEELSLIGKSLDALNKEAIRYSLWRDVAEPPLVRFAIGHSRDRIFLKYYVREKHIAALYSQINEPVYKDSCVEFFIGFGDVPDYYNLEFNCTGTVLGQYGASKIGRHFLDPQLLALISTWTEVKFNHNDQLFEWELTIAIPATVFEFHVIEDFEGMDCYLNFFKCGDDLPEPHYLAWSEIHNADPNFHLPQYFKKSRFEDVEVLNPIGKSARLSGIV